MSRINKLVIVKTVLENHSSPLTCMVWCCTTSPG